MRAFVSVDHAAKTGNHPAAYRLIYEVRSLHTNLRERRDDEIFHSQLAVCPLDR